VGASAHNQHSRGGPVRRIFVGHDSHPARSDTRADGRAPVELLQTTPVQWRRRQVLGLHTAGVVDAADATGPIVLPCSVVGLSYRTLTARGLAHGGSCRRGDFPAAPWESSHHGAHRPWGHLQLLCAPTIPMVGDTPGPSGFARAEHLGRNQPMTRHIDTGAPRSRLNEMRTAADRRLASLVSSFDDIVEAATGVATDDEHDPEGHTIAWERQQIAALLDEARLALAGIEAAEQRLNDGMYGICTVCSAEIAAERLAALPAAPTCVHCAR
jgi:DnaK suppressor protein